MTALSRLGGIAGRRWSLPRPPDDAEKHSYAGRSLPYLTIALVISLVFVVLAQALFEVHNLAVAWPFTFYTLLYFCYQALSLPDELRGPRGSTSPRTWPGW